MATMDMIEIGRWAVALERNSGGTLLRFDFTDAPPLVLLVPKDEAQKIADAIQAQYKNAPPKQLS